MALLMDHIAPNGARGDYFRILRIEGICSPREPTPRWEIWVGFYASQEIRAENVDPIHNYRINIPFTDLEVDPRTGGMVGFYSAIKNYYPFTGQAVADIVEDSDDLTLDAARAIKRGEINRAWLAANTSYFSYQDKQFSVDEVGHQNIMTTNGYIQLFGTFPLDWPGAWKTMDAYPNETYVRIATIDAWKAFYGAMVAQGVANYARAQKLKQMASTAATVEQVRAIDWSTAIPTT